jgi:hypothetical protein
MGVDRRRGKVTASALALHDLAERDRISYANRRLQSAFQHPR